MILLCVCVCVCLCESICLFYGYFCLSLCVILCVSWKAPVGRDEHNENNITTRFLTLVRQFWTLNFTQFAFVNSQFDIRPDVNKFRFMGGSKFHLWGNNPKYVFVSSWTRPRRRRPFHQAIVAFWHGLVIKLWWDFIISLNSFRSSPWDTRIAPKFPPSPQGFEEICIRPKKKCFTKHSLKGALSHLISNCYFTVGNTVMRQKIDIPMGIDPLPFWANLFYTLMNDWHQVKIGSKFCKITSFHEKIKINKKWTHDLHTLPD